MCRIYIIRLGSLLPIWSCIMDSNQFVAFHFLLTFVASSNPLHIHALWSWDVGATLWQTQIPLNEDLSRYIHFKDVPSEFTRVPKTTSLGRTCQSLAKQEASFAKTCKIKWRKNPSANKALAWAEECCFQCTTSGHQHTHEVECRSSQHPALDSFFCWAEEIMCMTYSCKLYFTSMLPLALFLIWQTCQTNRLACTKYVYALLGWTSWATSSATESKGKGKCRKFTANKPKAETNSVWILFKPIRSTLHAAAFVVAWIHQFFHML